MRKLPASPNDFREAAARCIRMMQRARAPVLKRLLRERAALLMRTAIELERAEALTADKPPIGTATN